MKHLNIPLPALHYGAVAVKSAGSGTTVSPAIGAEPPHRTTYMRLRLLRISAFICLVMIGALTSPVSAQLVPVGGLIAQVTAAPFSASLNSDARTNCDMLQKYNMGHTIIIRLF